MVSMYRVYLLSFHEQSGFYQKKFSCLICLINLDFLDNLPYVFKQHFNFNLNFQFYFDKLYLCICYILTPVIGFLGEFWAFQQQASQTSFGKTSNNRITQFSYRINLFSISWFLMVRKRNTSTIYLTNNYLKMLGALFFKAFFFLDYISHRTLISEKNHKSQQMLRGHEKNLSICCLHKAVII